MNGLDNNALQSPLPLVTGTNGVNRGAAVTADGATAQNALGSVATPLRLPLSTPGSFAGAAGGSPQARSGATAAMLNYPTNGAGSW